jgi:benzoyl-CoA reductase/2-hydroxyglutaryl-CoA dehydratase subunit BcrC/BadD/HgdB
MVGFTCSYMPLPLLDAAGFTPYRVLPISEAPDQAGMLLHDNMCPHVKRVLDRAVSGDLPELSVMVFMNSCETMRRLSDAWRVARPDAKVIVVDIPATADTMSTDYFAGELRRLWDALLTVPGASSGDIGGSIARYNALAGALQRIGDGFRSGSVPGGRKAFQQLLNRSVTEPPEVVMAAIEKLEKGRGPAGSAAGVPVYVFGNVLPDPDAFDLIENSGLKVVGDDLCTGSRQILRIEYKPGQDPFACLAGGLLRREPCARTLSGGPPGRMGERVVARAKESGARAVVAHVMKFCDPYLGRLPAVRDSLRSNSLPLLVLEGDCTARSMGQQRTRLEAFAEMLGGGRR